MQPENNDQGSFLPLTLEMRINEVCMQFEEAWQSSPAPRLEDFLWDAPGPERTALLRDLLRVELDFHQQQGNVPVLEDYLVRFPGHESLIRKEVEGRAARVQHQPQPEDTMDTGDVGAAVSQRPSISGPGSPGSSVTPSTVGAATSMMPFISWPDSEVGIPGYEIRRRLGHGGMGIVYEALQVKAGRPVALKVVRGGVGADPEELQRFRGEAEAAARLQHPNIAQIFEVGEHNGLPYFSMELCGAGSLDHYLRAGPMAPTEAAALVETLARAMHHAHQEKVIHRDLKPANILLSPAHATGGETGTAAASVEGSRLPLSSLLPKVGDFGLARKLDTGGQTQAGQILGTPSYMAPEQASGRNKELGPACDTYALGAILYECLTGRPPFKAASAWDTVLQVISGEPAPPGQLNAKVPRELETVCLKCLEKEPRKRYGSAEGLADDLRRFLRHEPIVARPAGLLYRFGKFCRRNKGLVAGVSAVFLVLVCGVSGTSLGLIQARTERDRAREAEQDARTAERETHRLLATSHYDAARLAMQRGEWRAALRNIDRALATDHPDSPALRLDRVRAWCAVHDIPKVARELEDLCRRTDLGDLEGQVLLWQADLALNQSRFSDTPLEVVLKQVRQALDRGLPPADASYARGLLARTSPEAVEHFARALREDPFNPRANGFLASLLIHLGRHREARERLLVAELLFPEEPSFRILHAQLLALQDDMPSAVAELEQARPQLNDKQIATAQALLGLYNLVPRFGRALEAQMGDLNLSPSGTIIQWMPAITQAIAALKDPAGDLFFPLPPVLLKGLAQGFPSLMSLAFIGVNPEGFIQRLGRAAEIHPDGLLYLNQGVFLANKDRPEAWARAEKAFLRAAEVPSVVPIHQAALFGAATSEWVLSLNGVSELRREMLRRAVQNARKVVALGVRPEQAHQLSRIALDAGDMGAAHWIVSEWERQAPAAPQLLGQKVLVAFRSGAYGRVIELIDQMKPQKPPEIDRWQKVRAAAVARLREQTKAISPPKQSGKE